MLPIRSMNPCFQRIQPIWIRFSSSTNDFIRPPGSIRSWILDQVAAHKRWRYANDPEYRKRRIELSSEWRLNRRKTDPEWRAKRTTYYEEQHHRRRNHLRTWLRHNSQARQLTWPEHSCVFYEERTIHVCSTCAQRLDRKLWWKRKEGHDNADVSVDTVQGSSDGSAISEKYDCHLCFTEDWSRALPIDRAKLPYSLRTQPSDAKDQTISGDEANATGPEP